MEWIFGESVDHAIIYRIKKEKLPVYVYGAGVFSKYVQKKLECNGIMIDAFVVDDTYLNMIGRKEKVTSCSYVNMLKKKCFIVIGIEELCFCDDEVREKFPYCLEVFTLSEVYEGVVDPITKDEFERNQLRYRSTYDLLEDKWSKMSYYAYVKAKVEQNYRPLDKFVDVEQYMWECDYWKCSKNEALVDAGAYTGDTIQEFLDANNFSFDRIYAFEPDINNYQALVGRYSHDERIECYPNGLFSENKKIQFLSDGSMTSQVSEGGDIEIEVKALDDVLKGKKVSIVKMDIEGCELEALRGARHIIMEQKPMLMICLEHRKKDLFEIPELIKSFGVEYRYYFRIHHRMALDAVLYAIPNDDIRRCNRKNESMC